MKFRLCEEHDPIKGSTVYYTQQRVFGMWLGFLSFIESSCTYQKDEALARFERIKKAGTAKKVTRVIEPAQQRTDQP